MKEPFIKILEGIQKNKPKHGLLNNVVHEYGISFEDAEEIYNKAIGLKYDSVRKQF